MTTNPDFAKVREVLKFYVERPAGGKAITALFVLSRLEQDFTALLDALQEQHQMTDNPSKKALEQLKKHGRLK